jgi:hypothetical protein
MIGQKSQVFPPRFLPEIARWRMAVLGLLGHLEAQTDVAPVASRVSIGWKNGTFMEKKSVFVNPNISSQF